MRTSQELLILNPSDFELSPQVTANTKAIRILGVDWKRLFSWQTASVNQDFFNGASLNTSSTGNFRTEGDGLDLIGNISYVIPIIGNILKGNTSSYALSQLMKDNPGYDVILYPQYVRTTKGIPLLYTVTEVNVYARLGKLKSK